MEHQAWKLIVALVRSADKPSGAIGVEHPDALIALVILWSAFNDRPICWATQIENWPLCWRRQALPSDSTVSRRYRTKRVRDLMKRVEKAARATSGSTPLVIAIDGKPLPIGGASGDKQAGYGRAAAGKAKGYKLHALVSSRGDLIDWRVAPMNKDEREMGRRLLRDSNHQGYVVGDKNYDSNRLHAVCSEPGDRQLVTPRRRGGGLGHYPQEPSRLRSIALLEDPESHFGWRLMKLRNQIERYFGNLTNWGGSLTCLPPWARTWKRVHRWVQAKIILNHARRNSYVT